MTLKRYSPPANLTDYDDLPHQLEAWSEMVSESFDMSIGLLEHSDTPEDSADYPGVGVGNSQFYNAMKTEEPPSVASVDITWLGYPRYLTITYGEEGGLQKADDLHSLTEYHQLWDPVYKPLASLQCRGQDEYCEWRVTHDDDTGKIKRITFTSEPPEYWSALAGGYPSNPFYYTGKTTYQPNGEELKLHQQKLLRLYREFVSPDVQLEDLFFQNDDYACPDSKGNPNGFLKGQYNPYNKWNITDGIMHLSHPANTLLAEIQLGADGTALRVDESDLLVQEPDRLICCARYGGVNRSTDPNIGSSVNQLARQGMMVTLKDPVGLYMHSLNTAGWTKPDGKTPIGNYWRILRGKPGMVERAVFEVPAEEKFTVSDILINGAPVQYAGQIAQGIVMTFTGAGFVPATPKQPKYIRCRNRCCRNTTIYNELDICTLGVKCDPGYEEASPGIALPSPKIDPTKIVGGPTLEAAPLNLLATRPPEPHHSRPGRR